MPVLAREGLIRRLVDASLHGRGCVVMGGPGMGKTTVARAAAERLAARSRSVDVIELGEGDSGRAPGLVAELASGTGSPTILTGGLALHRLLAESPPPAEVVRRFPLLPLLRRDLERWAGEAGARIPRDELERAWTATGGHPALFAEWLEVRRAQPDLDAIEKTLAETGRGLLGRIDRELAHPELAGPYTWLERHGPASVAALRRSTGASKPCVDRLAMVGPVSRSLGEHAEIRIACGLYARHRLG